MQLIWALSQRRTDFASTPRPQTHRSLWTTNEKRFEGERGMSRKEMMPCCVSKPGPLHDDIRTLWLLICGCSRPAFVRAEPHVHRSTFAPTQTTGRRWAVSTPPPPDAYSWHSMTFGFSTYLALPTWLKGHCMGGTQNKIQQAPDWRLSTTICMGLATAPVLVDVRPCQSSSFSQRLWL